MVCPLRLSSFKRFQSHYILIGGIKFGDLVLSIVERYLIQCPFLRGSYLRDSTLLSEQAYTQMSTIELKLFIYILVAMYVTTKYGSNI